MYRVQLKHGLGVNGRIDGNAPIDSRDADERDGWKEEKRQKVMLLQPDAKKTDSFEFVGLNGFPGAQ